MLVKYWKNFKWFLFIPLIVFVFIFKINNVSALVYKGSVYNVPTLTNGNTNSSLNSNGVTSLKWSLNNFDYPDNISLLSFKFGTYSFTTENMAGYYCSQWMDGTTSICSSSSCYSCVTSTSTTNQGLTFIYTEEGNYYVNAELRYVVNGYNVYVPCTLENTQEFQFYCPFNSSYGDPQAFEITLKNSRNEKLYYNLTLTGTQYYYNYDSAEITLQQQTTNTNLQYIYQYQQNDSVTGSTTQVQGDFSDLSQSFNEELQGVNDLSQLVLLPISLFMDLSTDNCQPLHLVVPFVNTSVDLPCMKAIFNTYFYGFYTIFTTIMSAIICYWVAIKSASLIKDIVDCDNDRIEVVDL